MLLLLILWDIDWRFSGFVTASTATATATAIDTTTTSIITVVPSRAAGIRPVNIAL